MPIRQLLEGESAVFQPADITIITEAFDGILQDFELSDRADPVVDMLARLTIELWRRGERSAAALRERVVREMWSGGSGGEKLDGEAES